VLAAVRDAGFAVTQFNSPAPVCRRCRMRFRDAIRPSAAVPPASASWRCPALQHGASGKAVRDDGLRRLACHRGRRSLSIPLVTLCTGTRNRDDQWAHHPHNADPSAWTDMAAEMEKALELAERHGVDLGIEPEQANIVTSADDAVRLIAEMGSKRLRIVLDPANLFERANAEEARAIVTEAIETTAGHVAIAHAKDRLADGRFATAGQGVVDFADFIARLGHQASTDRW
jgi:sugar phosphate isomerase/epimerase